jgi:aryl-alcohol dehydrogenase-like predicted oxidoreductase
MNDAVTAVIPGAKNATQAKMNAAADDVPALSDKAMAAIAEIYQRRIAEFVEQRW